MSYDQLERGSLFHGRYRVERRLGAGAMGAVYEVVDEKTQSLRALKVMQPNLVAESVHRERFAQEARVTGKIDSDHLVRVLDTGVDSTTNMPFLTMELLRGETLSRELERRRVLPRAEVTGYLRQMSFGLTKAHAAGIVHRDLKPDNLFVTKRDDGSSCIKILDFGIAKVVAGTHQGSATRVGTPLYMAPEQLAGKGTVGPPTDVHALGHIAYEMLVGEPYWAEEMRNIEGVVPFLDKLLEGPIETPCVRAKRRCNVTLLPGFDQFFLKSVARDPANRYANVTEFVEAFTRIDEHDANWAARTVAAGPLAQAFESPPTMATDTIDPPTIALPRANQSRDFDAATTIPRETARSPKTTQWLVLGTAILGCALIAVILLSTGFRSRTAHTTPDEPSALPTASASSTIAEFAAPTPSPNVEPIAVVESPVVAESAIVDESPAPSPTHKYIPGTPIAPKPTDTPSDEQFNRAAASSALNASAATAKGCKKSNGPTGTAKVKITFAPSGNVAASMVQGAPFAGTPVGTCMAAAFRSAKVPPFGGSPVSVTKSVTIN